MGMMDGSGTSETNQAAGGGLAEIGVMLRRRREEVGQDLATISATTHIKQHYLKAIEEGRRKDLPGTAYMIGYVRTYANYLGFDGNRLITDFHADLAGPRKWVDKRAEAAEPPAAAGLPEFQMSPITLAVVVLAFVVGIYGAWAFFSDDEGESQTASLETADGQTNADATTADQPAPVVGPVVGPATKPPSPTGAVASAPAEPDPAPTAGEIAGQIPSAAEDQVPPEADIASTGEDVTEESPPQPEPAPEAEAKSGKIVVRARLESWIQVTNAKKEVVFSRVLRAGETYTVPEEDGLTLTTGNAGGVDILLNGKKLQSMGSVGLVKRNVPLDAKKLRDGSAFKAAAGTQ
jgi:cytoskeleton protein RodZ